MIKSAELFDGFYYGMPRSEIEQRLKISGASKEELKNRTLDAPKETLFLKRSWREIFWFDNDEALRQIILLRIPQNRISFMEIQHALQKIEWMPVAVETEDSVFDIFERKDAGNPETIKFDMQNFEKETVSQEKGLTVYFFPTSFAEKKLKNLKIKFWSAAMDQASENFCLLSMMADADHIKLSFDAPLLARKAALKYGEMIKK